MVIGEKEKVKAKIKHMCETRGLKVPEKWTRTEVENAVSLIKRTCPFCKKQSVRDITGVICPCEIEGAGLEDYWDKD